MNICFLDGIDNQYTSKDSESSKLRGAENVVINLSKELSKLGNNVFVYNNNQYINTINGVTWANFKYINIILRK